MNSSVLAKTPDNQYGALINTNGVDAFPITINDIVDGTSNTIWASESAGRPYLYQNGVQQGTDLTQHGVNGGGYAVYHGCKRGGRALRQLGGRAPKCRSLR